MDPEQPFRQRRNLTQGFWMQPARPRVGLCRRLFETHERDVPCREELGAEAERKGPTVPYFGEAVLGDEKNLLWRLDFAAGSLRLESFSQKAGTNRLRDFPGRTRLSQKPSDSKPYTLGVMALSIFPGSYRSA